MVLLWNQLSIRMCNEIKSTTVSFFNKTFLNGCNTYMVGVVASVKKRKLIDGILVPTLESVVFTEGPLLNVVIDLKAHQVDNLSPPSQPSPLFHVVSGPHIVIMSGGIV